MPCAALRSGHPSGPWHSTWGFSVRVGASLVQWHPAINSKKQRGTALASRIQRRAGVCPYTKAPCLHLPTGNSLRTRRWCDGLRLAGRNWRGLSVRSFDIPGHKLRYRMNLKIG